VSEPTNPTIETKELSKLAVTAVLLSVANQQQAFQAVTADVLIDMGLNPKDGWQVYAPQGSVPFVGRSVAAPAPDAV
jgi:hypothetical protein